MTTEPNSVTAPERPEPGPRRPSAELITKLEFEACITDARLMLELVAFNLAKLTQDELAAHIAYVDERLAKAWEVWNQQLARPR